jgi:MoaA/NifB/PqqE/SkfB family radical SAM enzyme
MTSAMPELVEHVVTGSPALQLDGTKVGWYSDRVEAWARGERIAPITIDAAWTRQCNAACVFCAAQTQASDGGGRITKRNAFEFLEDCAEIGVKGVSLISDGESTVVPWYEESIEHGAKLGLAIGVGTNGVRLKRPVLERILPHIAYLRFNFSAGDRDRYSEIMGLKGRDYDQVVQNVRDAMAIVRVNGYACNVNMQMVVMPEFHDQILPLARLAKELRPTYLIYKHCADSKDGMIGVDYRKYDALYDTFKEAEAMAEPGFRVVVKWSRLKDEGKRDYQRCYGPPFIVQLSGNGLVAPCGQLFQEKYRKFHIGNITRERFRDIFRSDRYWEVMRYLSSDEFDAQRNCGPNCLQTLTNSWLDKFSKGLVTFNSEPSPPQMEFL